MAAVAGGAWLAGCAGGEERPAAEEKEEASEQEAAPRLGRVGAQLYTVRTLMEDDVAQTLAQVAEIGYRQVEFAGYFGHTPEEIRQMLDAAGLAAPSAHVPYADWENDVEGVIAAAQTVGHRYLVCPWLDLEQRQSLDDYRRHAVLFNEVAARCAEAGIQFAYHNHDFEFIPFDGGVPYDVLLQETDPALVQMELDLYWIHHANAELSDYLGYAPERYPLLHLKDRAPSGEIVPVGEGEIDFAGILGEHLGASVRFGFVEHDNAADPLASLHQSYRHLQSLSL